MLWKPSFRMCKFEGEREEIQGAREREREPRYRPIQFFIDSPRLDISKEGFEVKDVEEYFDDLELAWKAKFLSDRGFRARYKKNDQTEEQFEEEMTNWFKTSLAEKKRSIKELTLQIVENENHCARMREQLEELDGEHSRLERERNELSNLFVDTICQSAKDYFAKEYTWQVEESIVDEVKVELLEMVKSNNLNDDYESFCGTMLDLFFRKGEERGVEFNLSEN